MTVATVNNDVYRKRADAWWDDGVGEFSTIRFFVHPTRFAYFRRVLEQELGPRIGELTLLDVGCGGGILAEDFARMGLRVIGVDPAPESIQAARAHAAASDLPIDYRVGAGEELPFADGAFDVVACCDVLEHVDDVGRVIAEVARVLRPGGLFLFDTINRTLVSKLAMIKVMQEWRATAFVAPNVHVWERFVRPAELVALFDRHGLESRGLRGIVPRRNPIAALLDFRRRAQGKITFKELGQRLDFRESEHLESSYMGCARKRS
jgi:2-polyprenyl-6-hydroxyphenyl methylase / 3-demethylubiquinone-9 3-methyltransferase